MIKIFFFDYNNECNKGNNMTKFCVIDIETTGLSPRDNTIHQISGFVRFDRETKYAFNIKMQPLSWKKVDPAALAVSNLTEDMLSNYQSAQGGYIEFLNVLDRYVDKFDSNDKLFFVGYNSNSFDMPFIRQWFLDFGNKYFGSYFYQQGIDLFPMSVFFFSDALQRDKKMKLANACKAAGITVDETRLHDAMYDIQLTEALLTFFEDRYKFR